MVKGISKLVMDLTVRLTCVKGKVKSDSRFDLSFAKDQMCSKSNFSSRDSQRHHRSLRMHPLLQPTIVLPSPFVPPSVHSNQLQVTRESHSQSVQPVYLVHRAVPSMESVSQDP